MTNIGGTSSRLHWMDTLRGIAVLLVVFNHAVIFTVDTFDQPPAIAVLINSIFAPVRMPLMVLLSGLLLPRSLAKGAGTHVAGKVRGVLYPFAVWTVLILGYEVVSDRLRGRPLTIPDPVSLLVTPPGHVWFLQYLFVFYLAALLLYRVPAWIPAAAAIAASVVAGDEWSRFLVLFAYFFIGAWVATNTGNLEAALRNRWIIAAAVAGTAGLVALATAGAALRYSPLSVPFVLIAMFLAIKGGQMFAGSPVAGPFKYAGLRSLVFYLGHWFPTLFGVLAAQRFLPSQPYLSVLLGVAAGILGPLVIAKLYDRYAPVRLLFVLPKPRQARRAQPQIGRHSSV